MKHLFLINPAAGKGRAVRDLKENIAAAAKAQGVSADVVITTGGRQVKSLSADFAANCPDGRIYACGGDGTFNLVVNGIGENSTVSVGVIPVGTGNDFVRNLPCDTDDLLNIEKMMRAGTVKTDLVRLNGQICANACNIGFDAMVGMDMPKFKKLPLVSNQAAYYGALFYNVIKKLGVRLYIEADGELFHKGRVLMCTVSNGRACGGGFIMAPQADIHDGLLDLSLSLVPSRTKLGLFVKNFTSGTQNADPKMAPYIRSTRCKKVRIYSDKKFALINDGEGQYADMATLEIIPGGLNLIVPG